MDGQLKATSIKEQANAYEFSVCTLVNRKEEYGLLLQSLQRAGFNHENTEFIYLDNCEKNHFDGYRGINLFLQQAKGKYIIICHQDILFDKDNIDDLRARLKELSEKDPAWAVCGNAGANGPNHIVYHISYPNDLFMSKGSFPQKVHALDENFIVVKNQTYLNVSTDLKGFHLYATDLCLHAELSGFTSYVIAFNLTHKSRGNRDQSFFELRKKLIKKYDHFFRSRWIQTNSTTFHLAGSFLGKLLGNPIFLFFVRMRNGILKRQQ